MPAVGTRSSTRRRPPNCGDLPERSIPPVRLQIFGVVSPPHPGLQAMQAAYEALSPLEPEERERAMRWLAAELDITDAIAPEPDPPRGGGAGGSGNGGGGQLPLAGKTAKAFLAEKKPATAVERIACLAYYLTHAKNKPTFKTPDLVALNTEAAQPKFGNPARDVNNADGRNGFLVSAGDGRKQIGPRGEAVVEALPDREAVKKALADHPFKKRAARRGKGRASGGDGDE